MDDCGSVTRHMKASRTRQSGMAMWRAEVIMEAGGHSLEKACLPYDVTCMLMSGPGKRLALWREGS